MAQRPFIARLGLKTDGYVQANTAVQAALAALPAAPVELDYTAASLLYKIGSNIVAANAGGVGSLCIGVGISSYSPASGTPNILIGRSISTSSDFNNTLLIGMSMALGGSSHANSIIVTNGGAIGTVNDGVVVGHPNSTGASCTLVGREASGGQDSVAVGRSSLASGSRSTALGRNASSGGFNDATALGYGATCAANNQIVLGRTTEHVSIPGTGVASSTVTGALRVAGGAGIVGAVYADKFDATNSGLTASATGVNVSYTMAPAAGSQSVRGALLVATISNSAQNAITVTGLYSQATTNTNYTGTVTTAQGVEAYLLLGNTTGTVSLARAVAATLDPALAGVLATTVVGVDVRMGTSGGNFTATNYYGVRVLGPSTGTITNKYAFSSDANAGIVSINDTTASTSTATGALVVAGGIGVADTAWIGRVRAGNIASPGHPFGTQPYHSIVATAISDGNLSQAALQVQGIKTSANGGLTVGLYSEAQNTAGDPEMRGAWGDIRTATVTKSTIGVRGSSSTGGTAGAAGTYFTGFGGSTLHGRIGGFFTASGPSSSTNIFAVGVYAEATGGASTPMAASIYAKVPTGAVINRSIYSEGIVQIADTTASTNTTTGALVVAGGIGCADGIHGGGTTVAGSGQYAGALTTQGGVRAGYGLTAGVTSAPGLVVSQGATLGTIVSLNTYTAIVGRYNVNDSTNTNHHAAFIGRIGGDSGGTASGKARLTGVMGLGYFDAFNESHHHLTGGYFLADSQTTRPQDFHMTGAFAGIRSGNFRSNVAGSRAVGLDASVLVENASSSNSQLAYGVRSISSVTITTASITFAANYGGYFQATCNAAGAGSAITTAYGIYATASGAATNWAGWFQGDVKITGKLTVDGLLDPTGLALTGVAANPGGALAASTLWVGDGSGSFPNDTAGVFNIPRPIFVGEAGVSESGKLFLAANDSPTSTILQVSAQGYGQNNRAGLIVDGDVSGVTLLFSTSSSSDPTPGGYRGLWIDNSIFALHYNNGTDDSTVFTSLSSGIAIPGGITGQFFLVQDTDSYQYATLDTKGRLKIDPASTGSLIVASDTAINVSWSASSSGLSSALRGVEVSITNTHSDGVYGGRFQAAVDNAAGDAYGVYASAASSTASRTDDLLAGYFVADDQSSGSTGIVYGVKVQSSTTDSNEVYGVFTDCWGQGAVYGAKLQAYTDSDTSGDTIGSYNYGLNDATTPTSSAFGTYSKGESSNAGAIVYGEYAEASGGDAAYGIYATASGATVNWAGYFNGPTKFAGSQTLAIQAGVDLSGGAVTLTRTVTAVTVTTAHATNDLNLWAAPATGDMIAVRNKDGGATAFDINGNGKNIDGSATFSLADGESATLIYDGTEWTVF